MMIKNKFGFLCFLFCLVFCGCVNTYSHYIGEEYLGAKYKNNPLGENKGIDNDPLIRTDAFDCVTFVETSLAQGDVDKLNKIRYKDGEIDFLNRNHFIELDWLTNNKDLVENVSKKYGQTATRTVTIDKQRWLKKKYNINETIPLQTVQIKYIPYSNLTKIKNSQPLIVLFISGNSNFYETIGTNIAVVHMGFLLPNGKLRHASQKQGAVVDVDFYKFIEEKRKNKNNFGIALLKIK